MTSLLTSFDQSKRFGVVATAAIAVTALVVVGLASHTKSRDGFPEGSSAVAVAPMNLTGQTGMVVR
jgi:hypothetical protein